MNPINKIIVRARDKSGLTPPEAALLTGVSVHTIHDLEQHNDEIFDTVSLGEARRLCLSIDLDLSWLVSHRFNDNIIDTSGNSIDKATLSTRHFLFSRRRTEINLSKDEVATRLGFGTETIDYMERTSDFFECMPIRVLVELANILSLDPLLFISPGSVATT
jgi:DNA-binding transcriptional regulator YiaG